MAVSLRKMERDQQRVCGNSFDLFASNVINLWLARMATIVFYPGLISLHSLQLQSKKNCVCKVYTVYRITMADTAIVNIPSSYLHQRV